MTAEECEAEHANYLTHVAGMSKVRNDEEQTAKRDAALDTVPVVVVSHCWETANHPDPQARTLRAVASKGARRLL